MEIIKNKVEDIIVKAGYAYKEEYSDKQLNTLLNYWCFFDEKEKEIQELSGVSLEIILYSKYYWCTQCKNRFNELYGKDEGIDQQQYKIIEEMTQRINDVDWSFIQMIEEGINKMTYNESIIGKCAIIGWDQYKKIDINSFALDEEMQIKQLEEALLEINKLDNNMMIFASTYPIEKIENGIRMYSDMLWIKTKLSCIQLESLFSKYRQIEPSSIFNLTEEEKGYVELYIDTEFQHKEFAIVSNLFELDEIKIFYWD